MIRFFLFTPAFLTLLIWSAGSASAAESVAVKASRKGSAVEIDAQATLTCDYPVIWQTLTDYDHLADFIPGMRSSRVLAWQGNEAIVEQTGDASFLFFKFPIEVTVGSESRPPDAIQIRVIKGNLKRLDGGYRIERLADRRYVLRWRGLIEPEVTLVPILGVAVMRSNIEAQFLGMVKEIERRQAIVQISDQTGTQTR